MALAVKVGSFTSPAGTGNQTYDTGLGVDLDAIILIGSPTTAAADAFADHSLTHFLGAATGPSNEWALCNFCADAPTSMDTASLLIDDGCLVTMSDTANTNFRANLDSFGTGADAGQFTLNWTVTATSGRTFYYLALSGLDAQAGTFALPSAGATHEVNGVPFTPTGLLIAQSHAVTIGTIAAHAALGVGLTDGTTSVNLMSSSEDAVGTSDTYRHQRTSELHLGHDVTTGATHTVATLSSFDSDGFTLSISDSPPANINMGYLALGGCFVKVIADTARTATPGTKSTSGVGFQPKAGFFMSDMNTATTATVAIYATSLGFSDGTDDAATCVLDNDAVGNAQTTARYSGSKCLVFGGPPPANGAATASGGEAHLDTFDSDGFTLDWTTSASASIEFLSMLLGEVPEEEPSTDVLAPFLSVTTVA